jgi:transcriptional regulator with XRE-family HTH domain
MPARFPVGASYYGPEMTSAQLPSSQAVLPGTHAVRQQAFEQLRERAIALRRSGRSRREIKEILGITSNATLDRALRGEPPPEWTRRPRAKDDLHARARELREKGLDYEEIAGALGVSKSSVSLWVRDMPRPARLSYEESRKRSAEGARRYWAAERPVREAKRELARAAAATEIGQLSQRELLIAGAIAYWCEGSKSKPHRPAERVIFVNSDPGLIKLFLRFLEVAGVEFTRLKFRVQIHETADVSAAEQFWSTITGAEAAQFHRATLKRHNPRTTRKNVGTDYHGCLIIRVSQGADLYRKIEGWVRGAMTLPDSP